MNAAALDAYESHLRKECVQTVMSDFGGHLSTEAIIEAADRLFHYIIEGKKP